MTERENLDQVTHQLSKMTNMVQALQIVLWDICQMKDDEVLGGRRRDALVGLGDALEDLADVDRMVNRAHDG